MLIILVNIIMKDTIKKVNGIVCAIAGLISFLCFIDFTKLSENFDYPAYILGAPSLFSAILISILAVEIYRYLVHKNITIKCQMVYHKWLQMHLQV